MKQCQLFCEFYCTHAKDNKKVGWREKACFYAPDKPANQEVNFDVISNVMTFLTLRVKVKTVYSFKRPYFHE